MPFCIFSFNKSYISILNNKVTAIEKDILKQTFVVKSVEVTHNIVAYFVEMTLDSFQYEN